jgi:hypothetical protein
MMVEVQCRGGQSYLAPASQFHWGVVDTTSDIVAYRTAASIAAAFAETDPTGRDPHAPGAKLDASKPLPWLCITGFANALMAVAQVTTEGARKYTPNGWASVPQGQERYMEAFARHALALARGETVDADTQCLHKAQMAWNILASLELELREANAWTGAKP